MSPLSDWWPEVTSAEKTAFYDLNLSRDFAEERKNIGHSCLEVIGSHLTEDFLTSMKRENAESCPRKRKKAAFRASPVGRLFSLLKVRNYAKANRLAQKKNTSQVLWTLTGVFDIWWRIRCQPQLNLYLTKPGTAIQYLTLPFFTSLRP